MVYVLLRGQTVEMVLDQVPQIVSAFAVVEWDGDMPIPGQIWTGEAFSDPLPTPDPEPVEPVYRLRVSPVEFKMLFSPTERLAIRQAREYSGTETAQKQLALLVDDWWSIVDDPRLTVVDLGLDQTMAGLDMLVTAGILSADRRVEIGMGIPAI